MRPYLKKAFLIIGIVAIAFFIMKFLISRTERIPGETLTDAVLAQDTLIGGISPFVSIINEKTNCTLSDITSKDIIDSKVVEQPAISTESGKTYTVWKESWTVRACKNLIHIPIMFTQEEGVPGTAYVVSITDSTVE